MTVRSSQWMRSALLIATLTMVACSGVSVATPGKAASQVPERLAPVTPTNAPREVQLRLITHQPVDRVLWTEDGLSIIYVGKTKNEQGVYVPEEMWHKVNVVTNKESMIKPFASVTPAVLKQLGATYNLPESSLWFDGAISPSGRRIIYTRLQPGYVPSENKRVFPPIEIWIANSNGTDSRKLGGSVGCSTIYRAIWFEQEKKAIVECGYEGPPELYFAKIDEPALMPFGDITAYRGTNGRGRFSLSPDETKLAITNLAATQYTLQIVPLDGSEIKSVTQWAYEPRWSPDSQRLYYQKDDEPGICRNLSIHLYNLATDEDTMLVSSPLTASDGQGLNITCGMPFEISPRENALLFWADGLWLMQWTQ